MMQDLTTDTALVVAARDGAPAALEELVGRCLPLVYNIVGRALPGHADVDDVVQETMLRVVRGLPGLRDPQAFRSWLVAVTMNQIRKHHRSRPAPAPALDEIATVPDPGADFVGVTLTQLGLAGQRRETAEATRWLDDGDRELLSLWWLVVTGHMARAEMAEAVGSDAPLVSVRVNRMKAQLETGRLVVRALAFAPRCAELSQVIRTFDGRPSVLWRKRIGRHLRECGYCGAPGEDLIAPERLLAGLALVPLPLGYAAYVLAHTPQAAVTASVTATDAADTLGHSPSHAYRPTRAGRHRPGRSFTSLTSKPVLAAAALTASVSAALGIVALASPDRGDTQQLVIASDTSNARDATLPPPPTPQPTPSTTPTQTPSPTPTPTTTPTSTKTTQPYITPAEQVLAQINKARAAQGLHPYRMDTHLTAVAAKHNHLMIGGCGFNHYCDGEPAPCARDAGPDGPGMWCGENIASLGPVGDSSDNTLVALGKKMTQSLLAEEPDHGHRYNLLSPVHVAVGISIVYDHGTVWMTQEFGD